MNSSDLLNGYLFTTSLMASFLFFYSGPIPVTPWDVFIGYTCFFATQTITLYLRERKQRRLDRELLDIIERNVS